MGLSPAATLHRVRALKESGVIRIISAQLDPAAAGFALQVYVTATLARHDPRTSQIFEDQIRALPQIISADNVAGRERLPAVHGGPRRGRVVAGADPAGHPRGARLVTYLRLAEIKPPSPLPWGHRPPPSAAPGPNPAARGYCTRSGETS